MASLGETFRPEDVPESEFECVPTGKYLAQIIASAVNDTKSGTGKILNLTWEIMSGQMQGRMIFDRLNIRNNSEMAQTIGLQTLANICKAIGVDSIDDSEELHGQPVVIEVGIKEDKTGQYRPQNIIKKYTSYTAGKQSTKTQPTKKQTAEKKEAQPPMKSNRPWVKNTNKDLDDEIPF